MAISEWDTENIGEILAGHGDWFDACLLRLIAKADDENKRILRFVYPDHVKLVEDFMRD